MEPLQFWLTNIILLVLGINVYLGYVKFNLTNTSIKWFLYAILTSLIVQVFSQILWYKVLNNLPLLHLYTLLEFIFLSLFYRSIFRDLKLRYLDLFILLVGLFIIVNSAFLQPVNGFNNNAKTLTQLIFIAYTLIYLFKLPKQENALLNLLNSGILIYYSGSLFIFMFTNVLTDLKELIPYYNYLWLANAFLYLIFQLIILYGLWKTVYRQMKYSP